MLVKMLMRQIHESKVYKVKQSLKSTCKDGVWCVKTMFILWNFLTCSISMTLTSTLAINKDSFSFCLGKSVNFYNKFSSPSQTELLNFGAHLMPRGVEELWLFLSSGSMRLKTLRSRDTTTDLGSLVPNVINQTGKCRCLVSNSNSSLPPSG